MQRGWSPLAWVACGRGLRRAREARFGLAAEYEDGRGSLVDESNDAGDARADVELRASTRVSDTGNAPEEGAWMS